MKYNPPKINPIVGNNIINKFAKTHGIFGSFGLDKTLLLEQITLPRWYDANANKKVNKAFVL